jgi:hypothetical protein
VYKTTVALDITVSVMVDKLHAGRFRIKRPGGVAYFAVEGHRGIGSRLSAIARNRGFHDPLPFAFRADCPLLSDPDAAAQLEVMVREAAQELKRRFDVDLVLVFVDTIIAAAGYTKPGEENDAAMGQRIMTTLSDLSKKTGALVLGVDHFGKAIETGTRGTSATRATPTWSWHCWPSANCPVPSPIHASQCASSVKAKPDWCCPSPPRPSRSAPTRTAIRSPG